MRLAARVEEEKKRQLGEREKEREREFGFKRGKRKPASRTSERRGFFLIRSVPFSFPFSPFLFKRMKINNEEETDTHTHKNTDSFFLIRVLRRREKEEKKRRKITRERRESERKLNKTPFFLQPPPVHFFFSPCLLAPDLGSFSSAAAWSSALLEGLASRSHRAMRYLRV